jgi:hypothetical protein
MRKILSGFCILTTMLVLGMAVPAAAEKPAWAGNVNGGKHGHPGAKGDSGKGGHHGAGRASKNAGKNRNAVSRYSGAGNYPSHNFNFDDRQRAIIHDYFAALPEWPLPARFGKKIQWLHAARTGEEMGYRASFAPQRDFL